MPFSLFNTGHFYRNLLSLSFWFPPASPPSLTPPGWVDASVHQGHFNDSDDNDNDGETAIPATDRRENVQIHVIFVATLWGRQCLFPHFRGRNGAIEMLASAPKLAKLIKDRACIQTHMVGLYNLCTETYTHICHQVVRLLGAGSLSYVSHMGSQ